MYVHVHRHDTHVYICIKYSDLCNINYLIHLLMHLIYIQLLYVKQQYNMYM